jgi:hypothetical protein
LKKVGGGTARNLPRDIDFIGFTEGRRRTRRRARREVLSDSRRFEFVQAAAAFEPAVGTSEIVFRICEAIW